MSRLTIGIARTVCCAFALTLALTACQGTVGDGGSSTTGTTNATIAGVWTGSDSSGDTLAAFVGSDGSAVFVLSNNSGDEAQFDGTLQISGETLAASVDGYSNFGSTFSDGSSYGVGTLSGTIVSASSMTVTFNFTTSDNTTSSSTWTLSYDSLSTTGSALSTVSGTYENSTGTVELNISSDGTVSGTLTSGDCSMSGAVTTDGSTYDVYQITYTYEGCTGSYEVLNGIKLTGLATLDTNASPYQLDFGIAGENTTTSGSTSSTTHYGLIYSLNRD